MSTPILDPTPRTTSHKPTNVRLDISYGAESMLTFAEVDPVVIDAYEQLIGRPSPEAVA